MKRLHQLVSKRLWFVLFNGIAVLLLFLTGRLKPTWESILVAIFVLLVMNVIALISARNFPDWK
jgi:Na+/citrate or Na+/malate symporter